MRLVRENFERFVSVDRVGKGMRKSSKLRKRKYIKEVN